MNSDTDREIRRLLEGHAWIEPDAERVIASVVGRHTRRVRVRRTAMAISMLALLVGSLAIVRSRGDATDLVAGRHEHPPALWPSPLPEGFSLVEAQERPGVSGEAWAALSAETSALPLTGPRVLVLVRRGIADEERRALDLGDPHPLSGREAFISRWDDATSVAFVDEDSLVWVQAWGLQEAAVDRVAESVRVRRDLAATTFDPPPGLSVQWSGGAPYPLLGQAMHTTSVFDGPSGSLVIETSPPMSQSDAPVEIVAVRLPAAVLVPLAGGPAIRSNESEDPNVDRSVIVWWATEGYWVRVTADGPIRDHLLRVVASLREVPADDWNRAVARSADTPP